MVETPRSMMKSIEENGIDHLPPVPVQQYWILFFLSEQNSMSNGDRKERNAINIINASFFRDTFHSVLDLFYRPEEKIRIYRSSSVGLAQERKKQFSVAITTFLVLQME